MKGDKLCIVEVAVTPAEDHRVPAPGRRARNDAFGAHADYMVGSHADGDPAITAGLRELGLRELEHHARMALMEHLLCSAEYETHWRYATRVTTGWVDYDEYTGVQPAEGDERP